MSTTRRTVLGGALGASLLARLAGTASAATPDAAWGTVSGGWVELWWTPQAQAQLDQVRATVAPVAPATLVSGDGRAGVRFPIRSGTGEVSVTDPQRTQGSGLLDGGLVVEAPAGRVEVAQLRPELGNELVSGACTVNGVEGGARSLLRCGVSEGRLLAVPVPPGQPLTIRFEEAPVRATAESLHAFQSAIGTPAFTLDTVLAYLTSEVVYTPPGR